MHLEQIISFWLGMKPSWIWEWEGNSYLAFSISRCQDTAGWVEAVAPGTRVAMMMEAEWDHDTGVTNGTLSCLVIECQQCIAMALLGPYFSLCIGGMQVPVQNMWSKMHFSTTLYFKYPTCIEFYIQFPLPLSEDIYSQHLLMLSDTEGVWHHVILINY